VSWIGSEVWVSDIFHISSCAVTRSCGQVLGTPRKYLWVMFAVSMPPNECA